MPRNRNRRPGQTIFRGCHASTSRAEHTRPCPKANFTKKGKKKTPKGKSNHKSAVSPEEWMINVTKTINKLDNLLANLANEMEGKLAETLTGFQYQHTLEENNSLKADLEEPKLSLIEVTTN